MLPTRFTTPLRLEPGALCCYQCGKTVTAHVQQAKQLSLNVAGGDMDKQQAITRGLALTTPLTATALRETNLTGIRDVNDVLTDADLRASLILSRVLSLGMVSRLRTLRNRSEDGIITASDVLRGEVSCITPAEQLLLASNGIWFRGSQSNILRLIEGDPELLLETGLTQQGLAPVCDPGQLGPMAPDHGDRKLWVARYVHEYRVVPEHERIGRVPFSKFDHLLTRLRYLDRCYHCQQRLTTAHWHMEHTQRHARGGDNSYSNIKPVCVACHELKNLLDGTRQIGSCDDIALAAPMMGYSLLKLG